MARQRDMLVIPSLMKRGEIMARLIVKFKNEADDFINLEVDEFHEDGDYIKAYLHNELIVMVLSSEVRIAYISQKAKETR